jgi:peptidoglycan hydrolase-like protein with peptidoglycan-binding domain
MAALGSAQVGVFFYGGHGLQVGGQNYLVPIDAKLLTQRSLDFEMIRLDLIQRAMERNTKTNIIFLDACRDNPLARNLARALGTRSSSELPRGLAAVESGIGTLISFSTQPGSVALDGEGRNSPFAAALTKHLSAQESITDILIDVRNDVVAATNQQQVPWEHSALRANFFFRGEKPDQPPQPAIASDSPSYDQEAEIELWNAIADSKNPELFRSFADQFPNGRFAVTARLMTDSLTKERQLSEAETAKRDAEKAMEEARKLADAARVEREKQSAASPSTSPSLTVAALPEKNAADARASAATDRASLALDMQKELKRVGCYSGDIDGKWGEGTRKAIRLFAEHAKVAVPSGEPTQVALDALMARKDRACPEQNAGDTGSEDARSSARRRQQARNSNSDKNKGKDCHPIIGPYGVYPNPWCK